MTNKYRNYTDDQILNNAKEVYSMASLLRSLDLRPVGGNYINMNRKLQLLNVDTSHWTKQLWSKDKQLKDYAYYTKARNFKQHLIKDKGHKCEGCKLELWNGIPISLETHHKDGDNTNNEIINLMLLCPNCHSQTANYRNRKEALVKLH